MIEEILKELDEKYVVIVYNDPKALFFKYKGDPPTNVPISTEKVKKE